MSTSYPSGMILIVDDDKYITDLLKFNLNSEGYGVDVVEIASDVAFDRIPDYRILLVDAKHQEYNGLDLCRDIKTDEYTSNIPVIICSENEGEDDIIEAFDSGAEDFITKPFSLRELIARIKAILRRHPMKSNQEAKVSARELTAPGIDLTINTDSQKVTSAGMIIPLTKTEYAILLFLFKHRNAFFTRDDICQEVWKDDASSNVRIVDTNISRLRKKLGESGKHIINRYGMGYAFVDKVI